MDTRLRASPRHGGTGFFSFFLFFVSNPPRGRPFGGGGSHRTGGESNDYPAGSESTGFRICLTN